MDELCARASAAVEEGYTLLVLSDRGVDETHAPIPSLLATAGVHHHLVREGTRTRCALIVESGEAREVHHMALLLGYGAGAINPYLAFETLEELICDGEIEDIDPPREQPGSDQLILRALEVYGFEWDGPVTYQSTFPERHESVVAELLATGACLLYTSPSKRD